jgi:ribosome recycling factor
MGMPKDLFAQLLKDMDRHMLETIDAAKREFAMIRTGRANPAILDRVLVEYYGEKVPIKQVGTISAPEPRLLMISPWDKQMIKPIIGAITSSELGLNPNADGNVIRVPLPQLTTERRKELARMVGRKTEEAKVGLRNIRRDAVEKLRAMQKEGTISEDDLRRFQDQVQKVTDAHIEQLDGLHGAKEREIMEG